MQKTTVRTWVTGATALTFAVIAMTGVMLYFHLLSAQVKELHEVIGLGFVAAAAGHAAMHWRSMQNYFPKKSFVVTAVLTAAVTAAFVLNAPQGNNPKSAVIDAVLKAPLAQTAALFNTDLHTLSATLEAAGYTVTDAGSLDALAKANGVSPFEIVGRIGGGIKNAQ